jgi:phenylalanyl-tRNA synthetase beta subunit
MLSLRFQDPARTLTSEEVDASVKAIQSALRAAGAEIRGE